MAPTSPPSLPVQTNTFQTTVPPEMYITQAPTHAGHHPDAPVQTSRKFLGLSDAQKATRKVRQEALQVEQEAFNNTFTVFLQERYDNLITFAGVHNRKVEYIEKLMNSSSHYKPKRGVNLQNAKVHVKAAEVNTGWALGDCAKLSEIHQLVKEDPDLQNLSKEDERILKNLVASLRELKKNGAHPSNKASAVDYHTEVKDLNDCVSLFLLCVVCQTHTFS